MSVAGLLQVEGITEPKQTREKHIKTNRQPEKKKSQKVAREALILFSHRDALFPRNIAMVSPRLTHALRRCAPNTHFARPAYPFRSLATTSRLWTSNATASAAAPAEVTLSALSDKDALEVQWQDNKRSLYGYLWLRDNCQCDQCIHPSNRQKLHSSADIPLDIAPRSVTAKGDLAEVIWNKPLRHGQDSDHVSQYPLSWLQRYANRENCETYRFENLRPQTWDQSQYELDWVDYGDYMHSDEGLHTVVQRLYNKGLVFIDGVPTRDESVTQVAERIGPVYETFYGRDFDVKNVAKSRNIAYTSLYLGFHMDLMSVLSYLFGVVPNFRLTGTPILLQASSCCTACKTPSPAVPAFSSILTVQSKC